MLNTIKALCRPAVQVLNQPVVKSGIKNTVGVVTFTFGLFEIYDTYRIIQRGKISYDILETDPEWIQTAQKGVLISAKVSRLLSAAVSPPGVYLIGKGIKVFFTPVQLERAFGPNTIFAHNWKHPRHIISIVAFALALPTIAQGTYSLYRSLRHLPPTDAEKKEISDRIKGIQLRALYFNTFTSRPFLHIGNLVLS